jgi:putative redox protein
MADSKPPVTVELVWERELVFSGRSGTTEVTLDSASAAGPSPMQLVGYGLAGCMAMDVVHVLTKGRHGLKGLRLDLTGMRAETEPRRFTAIDMHYSINGSVPEAAVQRAIDLSREKYCSVWHSMRQDIELKVTFSISSE